MITLTGEVLDKTFDNQKVCLTGNILLNDVHFEDCHIIDKTTSISPESCHVSIVGCKIDTPDGIGFIRNFGSCICLRASFV